MAQPYRSERIAMRGIHSIAPIIWFMLVSCAAPERPSEIIVRTPMSPANATAAPTTAPTRVETSTLGYRLVYPVDWQLMRQTEFEERTARSPDGLSLISVAPYPAPLSEADLVTQRPFYLFSFVAPGSKDEPPVTWPDGSVYRLFTGTDQTGRPIAGATRIVRLADGKIFVMLYSTTPERWPAERAQAEILLAQSGPTP